MSYIAAALARSKGKDLSPPKPVGLHDLPAVTIGPAPTPCLQQPAAARLPLAARPPAATLRPPGPPEQADAADPTHPARNRVLRWAGVAGLLALAAAAAWYFPSTGHPAPSPLPPPVATAQPLQPPPPALAPARTGPSAMLKETMRQLPITAAAGGGSQRLSVSGKIYKSGDTVVDGLVLHAIENEAIIFRDAAGNLYTRRL